MTTGLKVGPKIIVACSYWWNVLQSFWSCHYESKVMALQNCSIIKQLHIPKWKRKHWHKQGALFSSVHAPVLNLAEFVVICDVWHPAVETRHTTTMPRWIITVIVLWHGGHTPHPICSSDSPMPSVPITCQLWSAPVNCPSHIPQAALTSHEWQGHIYVFPWRQYSEWNMDLQPTSNDFRS
jgi:hypothetical protein